MITMMLLTTLPVDADRNDIYTAVTHIDTDTPWITSDNSSYTIFGFVIRAEILNTEADFEQWFPNTNTEDLRGTVSLGGLEYEIIVETVSPMSTLKSYPANKRVEYEFHFRLTFDDQVLDILPEGEISFWIYTDQPELNTFYAYLESDEGIITYEYDVLPDFWDNYALYDESSSEVGDPVLTSEIDTAWLSLTILILLPITVIHRKHKEKKIEQLG